MYLCGKLTIDIFLQENLFLKAAQLNNNAIGTNMKDKWDNLKTDNEKLFFCFTWHSMTTIVEYFCE